MGEIKFLSIILFNHLLPVSATNAKTQTFTHAYTQASLYTGKYRNNRSKVV
jgi:hypothetical protein